MQQTKIRPTNLKLHEFPDQSFIFGAYIPEYICDNLVDYFESNKEKQYQGAVFSKNDQNENQDARATKYDTKKSTDIGFCPYKIPEDNRDLAEYMQYLNLVMREYEFKYDAVKSLARFGVEEGCNIQKYLPGEGFYEWHAERNSRTEQTRCLVWMTYLNDVPDGGTHFKYQQLTSPAKKGLTLIWPPDWHHTHKGEVSNNHTKYIITGWMNYLE